MEQIFESENFLIKVDDSCQHAFLKCKNFDAYKNESELLELLSRAGIKQEDVLSLKEVDLHGEVSLAKKPMTPELNISYRIENGGDYIKKEALFATVSCDEKNLNCFGDKEHYVEKYVKENFLGNNTFFDRNGIYSDKDGCPYQDEKGCLNVRDKFVVSEDLSQEVDEPFYGDLEVFGNVINTKIEVMGKLIVHGSISASQVKVHDLLIVHKNVMEYSKVEAVGDVSLLAATNSTIVTGGNLFFDSGLTACKIICQKSVVSDSAFSVIKSGEIVLGDFLICANLGNSVQLPLAVSIEVFPYYKYCLDVLNKEYYAQRERSEELLKKITEFNQKLQEGIYSSYDVKYVDKKYLKVMGKLNEGVEIAIYNVREVVKGEEKGVELSMGKGCIIKRFN